MTAPRRVEPAILTTQAARDRSWLHVVVGVLAGGLVAILAVVTAASWAPAPRVVSVQVPGPTVTVTATVTPSPAPSSPRPSASPTR